MEEEQRRANPIPGANKEAPPDLTNLISEPPPHAANGGATHSGVQPKSTPTPTSILPRFLVIGVLGVLAAAVLLALAFMARRQSPATVANAKADEALVAGAPVSARDDIVLPTGWELCPAAGTLDMWEYLVPSTRDATIVTLGDEKDLFFYRWTAASGRDRQRALSYNPRLGDVMVPPTSVTISAHGGVIRHDNRVIGLPKIPLPEVWPKGTWLRIPAEWTIAEFGPEVTEGLKEHSVAITSVSDVRVNGRISSSILVTRRLVYDRPGTGSVHTQFVKGIGNVGIWLCGDEPPSCTAKVRLVGIDGERVAVELANVNASVPAATATKIPETANISGAPAITPEADAASAARAGVESFQEMDMSRSRLAAQSAAAERPAASASPALPRPAPQPVAAIAATRAPVSHAAEPALGPRVWKDPATNLIWMVEDNGDDVTWNQAQAFCANLTLGGVAGWRLPAIEELASLHDQTRNNFYRVKSPLMLTGYPWSATEQGAGDAWIFNFNEGKREYRDRDGKNVRRALCVWRTDK